MPKLLLLSGRSFFAQMHDFLQMQKFAEFRSSEKGRNALNRGNVFSWEEKRAETSEKRKNLQKRENGDEMEFAIEQPIVAVRGLRLLPQALSGRMTLIITLRRQTHPAQQEVFLEEADSK